MSKPAPNSGRPTTPPPSTPTGGHTGIFCDRVPVEIHFMIGTHLLTSTSEPATSHLDLGALRRTCKHLQRIYTRHFFLALADTCTSLYNDIDPLRPKGGYLYDDDEEYIFSAYYRSKVIPRAVVNNGMEWLVGFVKAWTSSEPRDEREERGGRLVTNWVWVGLLKAVLKMFDGGIYCEKGVSRSRQREKRWRGREIRRRVGEEERLQMVRFLMTEFVPSLGDGIYESDYSDYAGSDTNSMANSRATCEDCINGCIHHFTYYRDEGPEYYGRYTKKDERGDETGPLLAKDEVWFEKVCSLMLKAQHVRCMRILVQQGGLEWRLYGYFLGESFLRAVVNRRRYNPEFLKYLEREKRISDLTRKIGRLLDSLSQRRRGEQTDEES